MDTVKSVERNFSQILVPQLTIPILFLFITPELFLYLFNLTSSFSNVLNFNLYLTSFSLSVTLISYFIFFLYLYVRISHAFLLPSLPLLFSHPLFPYLVVVHYFPKNFLPAPRNLSLILIQSNCLLYQLPLLTPSADYSQTGCSAPSLAEEARRSHPQPGLHTGTQELPAAVGPHLLLEAAGKVRSQGKPGEGEI